MQEIVTHFKWFIAYAYLIGALFTFTLHVCVVYGTHGGRIRNLRGLLQWIAFVTILWPFALIICGINAVIKEMECDSWRY